MTLELKLPESKIVIFNLMPHTADSIHYHENHYQISIPLQSNGQFQYNNCIKDISSHERLVLTPGSAHRHIARETPLRILLLEVNQNLVNELYNDINAGISEHHIEFTPWSDHSSHRFIQLANIAIQQQMNVGTSLLLEHSEIESEIVHHLIHFQNGSHHAMPMKPIYNKDLSPVLNLIIEYIYENLSTNLSLDLLAQVGNVSKYHLISLFKSYIGLTPSRYIRELRLKKAVHLLKNSKLSITEIAYAVGFASLTTFNRLFKQKYNYSPNNFREHI